MTIASRSGSEGLSSTGLGSAGGLGAATVPWLTNRVYGFGILGGGGGESRGTWATFSIVPRGTIFGQKICQAILLEAICFVGIANAWNMGQLCIKSDWESGDSFL